MSAQERAIFGQISQHFQFNLYKTGELKIKKEISSQISQIFNTRVFFVLKSFIINIICTHQADVVFEFDYGEVVHSEVDLLC